MSRFETRFERQERRARNKGNKLRIKIGTDSVLKQAVARLLRVPKYVPHQGARECFRRRIKGFYNIHDPASVGVA